ncbi:MAG: winged helix-turn-helix transcriptional regulator, partial [Candidatus Nitrosomaritimum yanchengensis]
REMKPQSLDMLVLGELNRGVKNFNSIQRNLEIDTEKLDETLQSLENQGLMKIQNKQGIFGPKIELIPTEKGFKKFYS